MSTCSSSPPVTPPSSDSEDDENVETTPQTRPLFVNRHPSPHPLAASTKATRDPPSYQKRYTSKHIPSSSKTVLAIVSPKISQPPQRNPVQTERIRWEVAIANTIDNALSKIDLSFFNLTYIPSFISDLKNLVILPRRELFSSTEPLERRFKKSATAPAGGLFKRPPSDSTLLPPVDIAKAPLRRAFARADTSAVSRFMPTKHETTSTHDGLELYLMSNRITSLPRELFELDRLVVLSLRTFVFLRLSREIVMNCASGGNMLTSLPPAIRFLKALRELNIANNQINYLPAEIQELRLRTLHLQPNPFLQPSDTSMTLKGERMLGPLTRKFSIPPLTEFALRSLLASDGGQATNIERDLSLAEIDALDLPVHMQSILRGSTGHSRARSIQVDHTQFDMRLNNCPSPHHRQVSSSATLRNVRFQIERDSFVFNIPSETRVEWVGEVAGVVVANTPKAFVPILWRGCNHGCLGFLEDDDLSPEPNSFGSTLDENGEEFEFSDDE